MNPDGRGAEWAAWVRVYGPGGTSVSAGGVGTIGTNPLDFGPSKALRINANAAGGGELRVQVTSG